MCRVRSRARAAIQQRRRGLDNRGLRAKLRKACAFCCTWDPIYSVAAVSLTSPPGPPLVYNTQHAPVSHTHTMPARLAARSYLRPPPGEPGFEPPRESPASPWSSPPGPGEPGWEPVLSSSLRGGKLSRALASAARAPVAALGADGGSPPAGGGGLLAERGEGSSGGRPRRPEASEEGLR